MLPRRSGPGREAAPRTLRRRTRRGLLPLQPRRAGAPRGRRRARRSRSTAARRSSTRRPAIRAEIARLLREMGRLDEAMAEARAAVALDQDDADAQLVLAQLLQIQAARQDGDAGAEEPRRPVRGGRPARPTDGQSLLDLAGIYGQLEDHARRPRPGSVPRSSTPATSRRTCSSGRTYSRRARPRRRPRPSRPRSSCSPTPRAPTRSSATSTPAPQQLDQAVLHYRKALELEPGNVRVRLALGEVLSQAKRPEEALRRGRRGAEGRRPQPFRTRPQGPRACATCATSTRPTRSPTRS